MFMGKIAQMEDSINKLTIALEKQIKAMDELNKLEERQTKLKTLSEKAEKKKTKAAIESADGTEFASKKMKGFYDVLTSTSDETKVFGLRAKTARKIVYGFLPPGAFRLVNKFSTSILAVNQAMLAVSGKSGEDAEIQNNMFTTLIRGYKATLGYTREEAFMRRQKKKELKELMDQEDGLVQQAKAATEERMQQEKKLQELQEQGPQNLIEIQQRAASEMQVFHKQHQDALKAREELEEKFEKARKKGRRTKPGRKGKKAGQESQEKFDKRMEEMQKQLTDAYRFEEEMQRQLESNRTFEITVQESQEDFQKRRRILENQLDYAIKNEEAANEVRDNAEKQIEQLQIHKNIFAEGFKAVGDGLYSVAKFTLHALKFIFFATLFIGIAMAVFNFIKPYLEDAYEAIYPILEIVRDFLGERVMEMYEGFTELINAIIKGDVKEIVFAAGTFLKGFLGTIAATLGILLVVTVGLVISLAKELFTAGFKWATKSSKNLAKAVGILATFALAWFIWSRADALKGTPLYWIVIAGYIAYALYKFLEDKVDFLANGGPVTTPMQVVGEKGPEIVSLPKGSRVHSNKDSQKMLNRGGGNVINVTVNASGTSDGEIRKIAQKVANIINREINRSTSSSMSR
tara:strand:- start:806 stop:2701 length:1896 start_codon:yes stop_codon:yes gene_type:complete